MKKYHVKFQRTYQDDLFMVLDETGTCVGQSSDEATSDLLAKTLNDREELLFRVQDSEKLLASTNVCWRDAEKEISELKKGN